MYPRLNKARRGIIRNDGFTLIETILSLFIVGVITALSIPPFLNYQISHDTSQVVSQLSSHIRYAQSNAMLGVADSQWGIHFTENSMVLFSGSTYLTRNASLDEVIYLPGSVRFGVTPDIVFTKLYGTIGSIVLININSGQFSRTLTVNTKGFIE